MNNRVYHGSRKSPFDDPQYSYDYYDPAPSSGALFSTLLLGFLLLAYTSNHFGIPVRYWPLVLWKTLVYITPAPLVFLLKTFAYRLWGIPTKGVLGAADMAASKGQVLKKVFGLDSRFLKSVQGDRSLGGFGLLSKGASDDVPPGLGNFDNSCYQNSVIQGLASLPSLQSFLSSTTFELGPLLEKSTQQSLSETIERLNNHTNHGRRLWLPHKLKSMDSWQQQDAQEYFSKIMDDMDREIETALKRFRAAVVFKEAISSLLTAGRDASDKPAGRLDANSEKSFPQLVSPMEGMVAQRVGCTRCGYSGGLSMTPFNCLTVPLGDHWEYDIRDCLDAYTTLEPIEGVECANCTLKNTRDSLKHLIENPLNGAATSMPHTLRTSIQSRLSLVEDSLGAEDFSETTIVKKCQIPKKNWVLTTKSRQAVIARAPKSLVIHLNRSIFDETFMIQRKNFARVQFPKILDLGPWTLGAQGFQTSIATDNLSEAWPMDPTISMLPPAEKPPPMTVNYELRAIVAHWGRHENGHYVCYRKHPYSPEVEWSTPQSLQDLESEAPEGPSPKSPGDRQGKWWRLSDDEVLSVTEEEVLKQVAGVFMLFYERLESSPEVTTMCPSESATCATVPAIGDGNYVVVDGHVDKKITILTNQLPTPPPEPELAHRIREESIDGRQINISQQQPSPPLSLPSTDLLAPEMQHTDNTLLLDSFPHISPAEPEPGSDAAAESVLDAVRFGQSDFPSTSSELPQLAHSVITDSEDTGSVATTTDDESEFSMDTSYTTYSQENNSDGTGAGRPLTPFNPVVMRTASMESAALTKRESLGSLRKLAAM